LKLSTTLLAAMAAFTAMYAYEVVMRRAINHADGLNQRLKQAYEDLNTEVALKTAAQAELQRRNEELERSQSFLSTVLNNVEDGIVACDHDGRLMLFNDAAKKFHGIDMHDVPPEAWEAAYDLYDEDGETLLEPDNFPLRRAFRGERIENKEVVVAPQGLQPRRLVCRGVPLFDSHGEKIGAVATMHDVTTERAQAEEMRRQRSELELIFDNVPVRIWLKDDKNTIIRLNKPAAAAMGVSVKTAAGASTYDLFPTMGKKYHDDDLSVIESGEPRLGIIEHFETKNGARSWMSTDKVPYTDEKTGERYVFVAATDITPMMEKAERLRQLNGELENFARVASHDLQEPLRKLLIFSDFLEQDLGEDLPDNAKKDLEAITSASKRMHVLVKDILELARMTGDLVATQLVEPRDIVDVIMEDLAPHCKSLGAVIEYDELPPVIGEPRLLRQVYQNLMGNALKFVDPSTTPQLRLTAERVDDQVVLGVKDNGIGVTEEHLEKIFQPLLRLHAREKYEGAGIGLAICKKAVESMGGRIWVESAPGQGAHFRFSLLSAHAHAAALAR
jgi:PAS domain S-box-containing protein